MAKGSDQFDSHFERQREQKERRQGDLPGADEAPLPSPGETIRKHQAEPSRNEPCPCGSGKKYKQCCLKQDR
ncbi:MAG: SEC-C metal-binding domain-containing protein [Dehalococcoidia bacterium]